MRRPVFGVYWAGDEVRQNQAPPPAVNSADTSTSHEGPCATGLPTTRKNERTYATFSHAGDGGVPAKAVCRGVGGCTCNAIFSSKKEYKLQIYIINQIFLFLFQCD